MAKNVFDCLPIDDMPAGYLTIRTELKIKGLFILDRREIVSQKINSYSGIQNLSVENINKSNKLRFDTFDEYIELGYPHLYEPKAKQKENGSVDDLIEEFKRLFPSTK